jgi:hypothetical protein
MRLEVKLEQRKGDKHSTISKDYLRDKMRTSQ